jgi:hypothetical protein
MQACEGGAGGLLRERLRGCALNLTNRGTTTSPVLPLLVTPTIQLFETYEVLPFDSISSKQYKQ